MTRSKRHHCADCGEPTEETLLCRSCAAICDALTRRGLYYAYRTGQVSIDELGLSRERAARAGSGVPR